MIGHKDFAADQSVSHTCDKLDKEQYLPGIQSLLLLYSIDAAIGPLIASTFMKGMGVNGLFIYFIIVCTLLSLFIAVFHLRLSKRKFKNPEEEHIAISMGTAYVTPRMDPRVNQDADKNTIAKSS